VGCVTGAAAGGAAGGTAGAGGSAEKPNIEAAPAEDSGGVAVGDVMGATVADATGGAGSTPASGRPHHWQNAASSRFPLPHCAQVFIKPLMWRRVYPAIFG